MWIPLGLAVKELAIWGAKKVLKDKIIPFAIDQLKEYRDSPSTEYDVDILENLKKDAEYLASSKTNNLSKNTANLIKQAKVL
jgi:hypothetical protein